MSENSQDDLNFDEINDNLFEENEEFELLVNQAEAEQMKADREKEVKQMNKALEEKLEKIKASKEKAQVERLVSDAEESKESFSGLILKRGGRMMKQEDVEAQVRNRNLIPLEEMDRTVDKTGISNVKAYFTIGVLVELSRPITSKSGKQFLVMKLTDLVKHDISKAKRKLEQEYKEDKEGLKMAEKSFNSNGYKCLKIMIFGDLVPKLCKIQIGTVIGLLNPKCMKPTIGNGYAFTIDLEAQLFKIGFAEDFALCKGLTSKVNTTGNFSMDQKSCTQFVNKAVETLCDNHKFMSKEGQLQKIRSQRIGLHSDYININTLKKQQKMMDEDKKYGAFGGAHRKQVKPKLSPKSREKLQQQKQKEQAEFNTYIKDRGDRGKKLLGKPIMGNIICSERNHLTNRTFPPVGNNNSKPKTVETEDDDCGLEFTDLPKKGGEPSLKNLILNGKMTFEQRFGKAEPESSDGAKRKKIE